MCCKWACTCWASKHSAAGGCTQLQHLSLTARASSAKSCAQDDELKQRLTSHQRQRQEVFLEAQRARTKPWLRLDPEVGLCLLWPGSWRMPWASRACPTQAALP